MKILGKLRNLFKRKKVAIPKKPQKPSERINLDEVAEKRAEEVRERMARERWLREPTAKRRIMRRRTARRNREHDLSKHFKGKGSRHQLQSYRRSVLAKVPVEEENN